MQMLTDKIQAIHSFWESFGVTAYDENYVPSDAPYPRITYDVVDAGIWGREVAMTAIIHSRSYSWVQAENIKKAISAYLGRGGIQIKCDNGSIWIKKAEPFAQRKGDANDDAIRQYVINISVEDHTQE